MPPVNLSGKPGQGQSRKFLEPSRLRRLSSRDRQPRVQQAHDDCVAHQHREHQGGGLEAESQRKREHAAFGDRASTGQTVIEPSEQETQDQRAIDVRNQPRQSVTSPSMKKKEYIEDWKQATAGSADPRDTGRGGDASSCVRRPTVRPARAGFVQVDCAQFSEACVGVRNRVRQDQCPEARAWRAQGPSTHSDRRRRSFGASRRTRASWPH